MILSPLERELGLQEQVRARQQAALDRPRDRLADGGFVVMAALVGGVDASETLSQGELGQVLRIIFFPGGSIQEAGQLHTIDR
jgi:hypothetical protein